jgi:cation transport ATPase
MPAATFWRILRSPGPDLRSLIDRAPKNAHSRVASSVADVPIEQVAIGDNILVRAGEVIPVDGVITSPVATLDEAAVTGEPIPVSRKAGELVRSGFAGNTFEIRASASATESTYAGIVRMVSAAQAAKAPFVRLADHYALLLLPLPWSLAGRASRLHRRSGTSREARHSRQGQRAA